MSQLTIGIESPSAAGRGLIPETFKDVVEAFCIGQAEFRAQLALVGIGPADGPRELPLRDPGSHRRHS